MYDQNLDAYFDQQLKLIAVTKNHEATQRMVVKFTTELTPSIAAALDATDTLKALKDGNQTKAVFEIGAMRVQLNLLGAKIEHALKGCSGLQAVAKVAKESKADPDPVPRIVFAFETAWEEADLIAVGFVFGKHGTVQIKKEQMEITDMAAKPEAAE